MRIIFVGIHNKLNKLPLDSSTKSGKIIDQIILNFRCECVKSNLFNTTSLPSDSITCYVLALQWVDFYNPMPPDIIVLLGKLCQHYFISSIFCHNILKIPHPASLYSNSSKLEYINNAIISINKFHKF